MRLLNIRQGNNKQRHTDRRTIDGVFRVGSDGPSLVDSLTGVQAHVILSHRVKGQLLTFCLLGLVRVGSGMRKLVFEYWLITGDEVLFSCKL